MTSFVDLDSRRASNHGGFAIPLIGVLAARMADTVRGMSERRAAALADARFLEHAKHDPRLLADLQAAVTRHQSATGSPSAAAAKVARIVRRQQRASDAVAPMLLRALVRLDTSRRD
jgi:hypothetical protein